MYLVEASPLVYLTEISLRSIGDWHFDCAKGKIIEWEKNDEKGV